MEKFRCAVCDLMKTKGKYLPYSRTKNGPQTTTIKCCTSCARKVIDSGLSVRQYIKTNVKRVLIQCYPLTIEFKTDQIKKPFSGYGEIHRRTILRKLFKDIGFPQRYHSINDYVIADVVEIGKNAELWTIDS